MNLSMPGITLSHSDDMLVIESERPLKVLSSAVVGGGLIRTRRIVNAYVDKDYRHTNPQDDLTKRAASQGISEPFAGLMTAVPLRKARASAVRDGGLAVAAIITAGLGNLTSAGLSEPHRTGTGTINIILLVDANLTPGAMANAIITATEAKTHILLSRGATTEDGHPGTGTSTDSVVVACTGNGESLPFAGTATPVGWLIGRAVREALNAALGLNNT
jgi:iron complex transport system ATP-binding protein